MAKSEEKVVEVQQPVTPPVTEKIIEKQVIIKQPRRRMSLRTIIRLFLFFVFATIFVALGVYISNTVIPTVKTWLMDHNFIVDTRVKDKETNSPFLPQPTETAGDSGKGSPRAAITIPEIVEQVSPSVVSIAVKNTSVNPRGQVSQESDAIGTGFIIDAAGIIVTNQHVVGATNVEYEVVTNDDKTYKPKSIIRDEVNDIAFIIIDAKNLPAVRLGKSDDVRVGETVIAIGTPLGDYPGSVTVGVVSGLGRTVKTSNGFWGLQKEYENVLQTDAAINPGNSGGPLINLNGQVIGVNFATTGGADNISFALPVSIVTQKLSEYKEFGAFKSPYLGVGYRMITQQQALYYNVEVGALVTSVAAGSPAELAKIQIGDIITKINAKPVTVSLASSLGKFKVGETVTVTLLRLEQDNKESTLTVQVKLAEKP